VVLNPVGVGVELILLIVVRVGAAVDCVKVVNNPDGVDIIVVTMVGFAELVVLAIVVFCVVVSVVGAGVVDVDDGAGVVDDGAGVVDDGAGVVAIVVCELLEIIVEEVVVLPWLSVIASSVVTSLVVDCETVVVTIAPVGVVPLIVVLNPVGVGVELTLLTVERAGAAVDCAKVVNNPDVVDIVVVTMVGFAELVVLAIVVFCVVVSVVGAGVVDVGAGVVAIVVCGALEIMDEEVVVKPRLVVTTF